MQKMDWTAARPLVTSSELTHHWRQLTSFGRPGDYCQNVFDASCSCCSQHRPRPQVPVPPVSTSYVAEHLRRESAVANYVLYHHRRLKELEYRRSGADETTAPRSDAMSASCSGHADTPAMYTELKRQLSTGSYIVRCFF